jgi:hypothetical protein
MIDTRELLSMPISYARLWFPLGIAHTLDFRTKKVSKIPLSVFVATM